MPFVHPATESHSVRSLARNKDVYERQIKVLKPIFGNLNPKELNLDIFMARELEVRLAGDPLVRLPRKGEHRQYVGLGQCRRGQGTGELRSSPLAHGEMNQR